MIIPSGPVRVLVLIATQPVDFRKRMDGLAAVVEAELRADPFLGSDLRLPRQAGGPGKAAVL